MYEKVALFSVSSSVNIVGIVGANVIQQDNTEARNKRNPGPRINIVTFVAGKSALVAANHGNSFPLFLHFSR